MTDDDGFIIENLNNNANEVANNTILSYLGLLNIFFIL